MRHWIVVLVSILLFVACEPDETTDQQVENTIAESPSEEADNGPTEPLPDGNKNKEAAPSKIYINIPPPVSEVKNCDQAAQSMFLSVADVQDILKDTTLTYVFEYKPEDEDNPNGRYWFWIFSTTSASASTVARYQVDPNDLEVYEYDPIADEAIKVKADKKLRKTVMEFCK